MGGKLLLLRRTMQLVIWVSLFSVFICCPPGFSVFPNSFNIFWVSTYLLSVVSGWLQKKYMFLLCNALLAFLATTSDPFLFSSNDPCCSHLLAAPEPPLLVAEPQQHAQVETQDQQHSSAPEQGEKEEAAETDQQDDLTDITDQVLVQEDDDGDNEEEQIESLVETETAATEDAASTEELNHKIEEFITKVNEEMRIQVQQQLVAV